ncbi:CdaR family protein [Gaoshiqia sp. Z1-71]|uniref:CdaR family protein n=1 Tax=Gaoshiqia hydrogeniformans TaxID=3290090 RepID=UPI003BF7CF21
MIYLICLGIATVFWFLNALNKEYSVELPFPVRFTNLPKNKVLVSDLPDHFILKVNSYGFILLQHKLSLAFSPLVFNVNELTGNKMENSDHADYAITSKQYISKISSQVSKELTIIDIQPDTLFFRFDRIVERKIRVKPEVSYELGKQHFLISEITSDPDSVLVSGPETILDTLKFIKTKPYNFKELNQTTQRNMGLTEHRGLTYKEKRVSATIPVEEFTEKHLVVPISITGLPEDVQVKLFPDKAKVSFMTGLTHFSEILPSDFKLSVSYKDIQNKAELLELRLESQPPHLLSVSVNPNKVEYLIEK